MAERTVLVRLIANTAGYNAPIGRSAALTGAFNTQAKAGMASAGGLGRQFSGLAGMARGLAAPLGILAGGAGLMAVGKGLVSSAQAAIEWESAFADVRKTVSGTPEQLAEVEQGLRTMSTQMPMSAEGLAAIAASAGQLGIKTPNVVEFTEVIAELGVTTNLAGEQGAQELARFANIVGMSQDKFRNLGSAIVDLGNNFATTEAEISSMALRIAGAGRQVGLTEGDILGLAAALSSVGIEAEAGGTAMSRVLKDIAVEVETGGDKLETFAQVAGMTAGQFATAFREDAGAALTAFIQGLGTVEQRGGSTLGILEQLELSDIRVSDALLRAAGSADIFTEAMDTGNVAFEEATKLGEEAAVRFETTASKLDILGNSVKELSRSVGEEMNPHINAAVEELTAIVQGADRGVEALSNLTETTDEERRAVLDLSRAMVEDRILTMEAAGQTQALSEARQELATIDRELAAIEGAVAAATAESYDGHLRAAAAQADSAAAAAELGGELSDTEAAAEDAAEAIDDFTESVDASIDSSFGLEEAADGVADALNDITEAGEKARDSEDEHTTALEGNSEAALENRETLRGAVEAIAERIQKMAEHGASSAEMRGALEEERQRFIDTAEQAGFSRDEIDRYVGAIEQIPSEVNTDINVFTAEAERAIRRLAGQLDALPRNRTINVATQIITRHTGQGGIQARADGGRYDPGLVLVGERGPELLYMEGRGFVHNNADTRRMLGGDPIAGAKALGIPGMAGGGTLQADSLAHAILRGPREAAANLGFPDPWGRFRNYRGFHISEEQQLNRAQFLFDNAPLEEQKRTLEILYSRAADYSKLWVELRGRLDDVNERMRQQREEVERTRQRIADLAQQMQTARLSAFQRRTEQIAGFASITEGVAAGALVTPDGLVQESFGAALLRNIQNQAHQIKSWKEGLQQLRSAGASEELIRQAGLDRDPSRLADVRGLLADPSLLGALNAALETRTGEARGAMEYEAWGGYGQWVDDLKSTLSGIMRELHTLQAESARPGSRFVLDVNGTQVDAVMRRVINDHEADSWQRHTMGRG